MENALDNKTNTFGCNSCGANLKFLPGTTLLKCDYCGASNDIPIQENIIQTLDFNEYVSKSKDATSLLTISTVKCDTCGASSSIDQNRRSDFCPYCTSPLIIDQAITESVIQPASLLPFKLNREQAQKSFKNWISNLWFAPFSLNKSALNFDYLKGVYIPYWSYYSDTNSIYTGQRGEYYYETQSSTNIVNGKETIQTKKVRKTKWIAVNGSIKHYFNDVLLPATESVSNEHLTNLEPWDINNLVLFNEKYLSGFITEKYQVNLESGFKKAKIIMNNEIKKLTINDIGGDEQRIATINTDYDNIKFKHLLLPVYVSAYKFNGKVFQFIINARTGEVQGKRPWSSLKILLLVIFILSTIAIISFYMK